MIVFLANRCAAGYCHLSDGQTVVKDKKVATLAAFITAANQLVLMSASRSIPDILLVLFLTISAWGFLEILLAKNPTKRHFLMAYLGTALAFETKGIPVTVFAGTSNVFLLFNHGKRENLIQLIEPVSIIVSVLIALSWFILMYIQHSPVYLSSFFEDQVGKRVINLFIDQIKIHYKPNHT